MAIRYDGPGEAFLPIQVATQMNNQNPWLVIVQFFPFQQSDIRVRGSVFVFRNLTSTAIGDFIAYEQFRQSNDRAGYIIRWNNTPGNIISVVPYYDFFRVQIREEAQNFAL